jgi:hypothetical protein
MLPLQQNCDGAVGPQLLFAAMHCDGAEETEGKKDGKLDGDRDSEGTSEGDCDGVVEGCKRMHE